MKETTLNMPTVALRGMTIVPAMIIHFDISRDKSVKAVEAAMQKDQRIFLVAQLDPEITDPGFLDLHRVGTICNIKQVVKLPKNIFRVLVEGQEKAEMVDLVTTNGYLEADLETAEEEEISISSYMQEAMLRSLKDAFQLFAQEHGKIGKDVSAQIMEIQGLPEMVQQLLVNLPLFYQQKQQILEADGLMEQCETIQVILENELHIARIKKELQNKVKDRVDKNQREYLMREQMRVLREELGEDNVVSDADHYQEQLSSLQASEEVKKKIRKEIDRFKSMGTNSSESTVLRGYIETLLEMPWEKTSRENQELSNAQQILNEDHYGLEKVKERILEFLAVRILTKKGDAPILCLVGPPGTGKTSIAKSVARALEKKYVRICLGGVRDEAEIRGHRRTYVGAMPGRIANGIKAAGVKNPLMLLDEIDKVSSDYKGDTSSALLEVLDSEQNSHFRDHYIEIPIDLSEVFFIATANDIQTVPRPLLDRMEVIEVSSYTENEKFHIAKEHLVKKQIEKNGLTETQISFTDKAIRKIISEYTREAGVRNLERKLGSICRKAAREILEKKQNVVKIREGNLEKYLGKNRYTINRLNDQNEVGIVRGLAWTSVGGETLEVEVNLMPGKGEFVLTGQLGDVMKESAQAGISYIRSVSDKFEIAEDFFQNHDIHIHIPEGAVPKDGPSAGITMATAMLSAITNVAVYANVAMTGEITLRGRVLPIGGLKEKLLAAKNAGIQKVLVPEKNRQDVEEISTEIKRGLEIVFVSSMEEVIDQAFVRS